MFFRRGLKAQLAESRERELRALTLAEAAMRDVIEANAREVRAEFDARVLSALFLKEELDMLEVFTQEELNAQP
jgi:hypothetical protein